MSVRYLIRLDDACPTMDTKKWQQVEYLLDKYQVCPMVGIIPKNADTNQKIDAEDYEFWDKVSIWVDKGWTIALHGYDHCYISNASGINPLWNRSEFAGVPLKKQRIKIQKGIEILRNHGINPKYFFAPSHTFDKNTLEALRKESDIRLISDTMAFFPYKKDDFIFIPCQMGHIRKAPLNYGLWTICLHPSTMNEPAFEQLEFFLKKYSQNIEKFDNIPLKSIKGKSILDSLFSKVYFLFRKIKSIKEK